MQITKALIIAEPWISYILDGTKSWEMRASSTSHRGWFGLIRRGSGAVVGVARLTDVGPPRSPAEMLATVDRHRIPEDLIRSGQVSKWNTPWFLADVKRLETPVSYRHKSGAVTWVALENETIRRVGAQLQGGTIGGISFEPSIGVPPESRPVALESSLVEKSPKSVTISTGVPTSGTAGIVIEINEANLRNNHFYLRSHVSKFPGDVIGGSNKSKAAKRNIILDWGGAVPTETDIDGEDKMFFRARSWIGAFYKLHDAKPGDFVVIEPVSAYRYRVGLSKLHRATGSGLTK